MAIAGTQIEHAPQHRRQALDQCRFTFDPARDVAGAPEVCDGMLGGAPEVRAARAARVVHDFGLREVR